MESNNKNRLAIIGIVALACISFAALAFGLSSLDAMKHPNGQVASISVSGEGEVTAVPDIATVNFTVRESAKTVPEAQKLADAKVKAATDALTVLSVDTKDTKTTSYTVNPKYESQQTGYCSCYVCPPTKTIVTGYEVAVSITVKVRKVDTAGDVIGALGKANITEISGPEFTVDDMDKAKADAKAIAIKKAQAKAQATADALGVSLGSIISFNEDNGGIYAPMMYKASGVMAQSMSADASVSIPQGESVIKSNVSITYTLK